MLWERGPVIIRYWRESLTQSLETEFGLNWWIDLLTTLPSGSELQVITAPSLIFTLYRSLTHTHTHTACSVFTSRSLETASNSGDYSASRAHVVTVWRISRNSPLIANYHSGVRVRSQIQLLYDWRFTANQFVLATSPLRLTTTIFSTEPLRS
jgi:hypothetical protein